MITVLIVAVAVTLGGTFLIARHMNRVEDERWQESVKRLAKERRDRWHREQQQHPKKDA